MGKKQFFLIADTETTVKDTVADFGAIVVDRTGTIHAQCGILVAGHFDQFDLFYDPTNSGFWSRDAAVARKARYVEQLTQGTRMLASVAAINRWLEKANAKFSPTLTAYNLAFDVAKCGNTAIDLTMFADRFCLWAAAVGHICKTKAYRKFVIENHLFNAPTEKRNMTYKTNAETVAGFLAGELIAEPHTALEDAIHFELPILSHIVKRKAWREKIQSYDWKAFQVRDSFEAK
jgi:hypothetical protein